ncbi:N-acyl-D-glucosamine 2-epimerase [Tessaracoccus lapidicaptus]|uniref:N-acyl-D-glucosamine 2-epimerase n=1 Tax=Tessaracoccus lapidicaptus TaxID=1427523 RepID=A0A1C0ALQ8_9ACTN|nr:MULTISPECIES: AGE family epimerase/isomerase [Tessaracoccus]AQX15440.1 N-acyl-D-glucosamine 2-epimerase [Tessaracoccus sp. T2.5-30]OCL33808.1 N-acyl-D-glucosamine 2-epimerase [Tessaracoccus lapidicaptus]
MTDRPTHDAWLDQHLRSLLDFGMRVPAPEGGAGYLDTQGRPVPSLGVQTYVTARMVHVYSLGAMLGIPGCRALATELVTGLNGQLHDDETGGWWHQVSEDGTPDVAAGKQCYDHAFVLLAGSSATLAGIATANVLLDDACTVYERFFWDEGTGRPRDLWDAGFTNADPYRGLNSSMHSVEAMMATAEATGDAVWLDRAGRVASFVVDLASTHQARLPEHFDEQWTPLLDFNSDRPDDQFKPFGATVGHGFEWSRLLLQVEVAMGDRAPTGLSSAAVSLFERAVSDGWTSGTHPGFVYTTDFNGRPVVQDRMHWVVTEAIAAAHALFQRTGNHRYAHLYDDWWDIARLHFIDDTHGSWFHQLDQTNQIADGVWPGKPDLYHAVQATLLPRLPLAGSIAAGVKAGLV